MQNRDNTVLRVQPMPLQPLVEPAQEPISSGQDIIGQFRANMQQVAQLQKKLNFMMREVNGLVKPKKK